MFHLIYLVSFIFLLVWAFKMMSQGFFLETEKQEKRKKQSHPEIEEISPGEILMGVSFKSDSEPDDLHEDLMNRIQELRELRKVTNEIEKDEEDDDDDDGVKVPALV